jgi:hypothetical protein
MDIIEHASNLLIKIPVEANGNIALFPAFDELVVKIYIGIP